MYSRPAAPAAAYRRTWSSAAAWRFITWI